MAALENAREARFAHAVAVEPLTQELIRKDHGDLELGRIRLSGKYGHSVSVI